MIYVLIGVAVVGISFFILMWLRKAQYDAIHRNFLDLVDRYGGRVIRGGFAIRPKFAGTINNTKMSISISSERKKDRQSRQFYISVYMQASGKANFTVLSNDWLNDQSTENLSKRFLHKIYNNNYLVEVSRKESLKKLDFSKIESVVKKMDPFAYVLVSKKGIILERLSRNLLQDTEISVLQPLLEGIYRLKEISPLEQ
jgi:hypothetical protein